MNKGKANRFHIKKTTERKLISHKIRNYIYLAIFFCCCFVLSNLHQGDSENNIEIGNYNSENYNMTYIFHDYYGNEYILNQEGHGSADSFDVLFDKTIPESLKNEDKIDENQEHNAGGEGGVIIDLSKPYESDNLLDEEYNINESGNTLTIELKNSVNLGESNDIENNKKETKTPDNTKDNQISYEDILNELGINEGTTQEQTTTNNFDNSVEIELNEIFNALSGDDNEYSIKEVNSGSQSFLIIELEGENQEGNEQKGENSEIIFGKTFEILGNGLLMPTLTPWENLSITNEIHEYLGEDYSSNLTYQFLSNKNQSSNNSLSQIEINRDKDIDLFDNITVIDEYAQCMTPWGYKIDHGESVLAYEQRSDAPDICNIERRYCRDGKLSGKFTQAGCSVNNNYTYYKQVGDQAGTITNGQNNGTITQNPVDMQIEHSKKPSKTGTGTTKDNESFIDEVYVPNPSGAEWTRGEDNIKVYEDVDQTSRDYPSCITPRGETVKHGHFILAFRHANGFSDSPCVSQLRLCSVGQLDGSYTEPSCKTRETSFIDWINGSPTRETYSEEKLERVKKIIKSEKVYDVEYKKLTNSDALDRILYTLEKY